MQARPLEGSFATFVEGLNVSVYNVAKNPRNNNLAYRSNGLRVEYCWSIAPKGTLIGIEDLGGRGRLPGEGLEDEEYVKGGTLPRLRALASQLLICSFFRPVLILSSSFSVSVG